jgi:hypothetical protein
MFDSKDEKICGSDDDDDDVFGATAPSVPGPPHF